MLDRMRHRTPPKGQPNHEGDSEQALILLNRIEAALVIRDPGNARSAEAYDGLRKQVIAAANERRRMLVMLAQLNKALQAGTSANDALSLVQEWSDQAGLQTLTEPITPEHFEIVGSGTQLRVVTPAWIDSASGMVVNRGLAEAVDDAPPTTLKPAPAPAPTEAPTGSATDNTPDPALGTDGANE